MPLRTPVVFKQDPSISYEELKVLENKSIEGRPPVMVVNLEPDSDVEELVDSKIREVEKGRNLHTQEPVMKREKPDPKTYMKRPKKLWKPLPKVSRTVVI